MCSLAASHLLRGFCGTNLNHFNNHNAYKSHQKEHHPTTQYPIAMSESQTRASAPRGRGSGRGGRGGYHTSRGGRSKQANGETVESAVPTISYEDQGEIGQLKKKYASSLTTIKEMFPDWTEDDIVFALEESNGDMERTVERMTEGEENLISISHRY